MAEQELDRPAVRRTRWVALCLALILFLDQKIVSSGNESAPASDTGEEQKPRIDFYSVLPKREVEIPISEEDRAAIENPSINKQAGTRAILQVGSFQSAADADSMKAQLAFLGLEARIQAARLDAGTWHRVELGPFASNSKLSQAKNLLHRNNIQFIQREAPQ